MLLNWRRILGIKKTRQDLIREEIRATAQLFPRSEGRAYDFFYYGKVADDAHEWVFHEWHKRGKEWHVTTTRYLVKPDAVYRSQGDQAYKFAPYEEMRRLLEAIRRYYAKVETAVYS